MMDFTGKIVGLSKDWESHRWRITLSMDDESALDAIENLKQEDKLAIHITKWRKKRSTDANAYLWVLCQKVAEKLSSSKEEVYEQMLQSYGTFYKDDEGYVTVTVKESVDMSKVGGHWKFIKTVNGFSSYLMLKGSSVMDSKEMSVLLDGVISECKELNIETMPDYDKQIMIEEWGEQFAKEKKRHNR